MKVDNDDNDNKTVDKNTRQDKTLVVRDDLVDCNKLNATKFNKQKIVCIVLIFATVGNLCVWEVWNSFHKNQFELIKTFHRQHKKNNTKQKKIMKS